MLVPNCFLCYDNNRKEVRSPGSFCLAEKMKRPLPIEMCIRDSPLVYHKRDYTAYVICALYLGADILLRVLL